MLYPLFYYIWNNLVKGTFCFPLLILFPFAWFNLSDIYETPTVFQIQEVLLSDPNTPCEEGPRVSYGWVRENDKFFKALWKTRPIRSDEMIN